VWLRGQPTVEIISRDRCGLYADGARQGAPAAQQITDRHHSVSNLAEALERDLQRLQIGARAKQRVAARIEKPPAFQPTLIEARRQRCRQARMDRFQTVIDLGAVDTVTTPSRNSSRSQLARCPMVTSPRLPGAADSQ
jgi:transposase